VVIEFVIDKDGKKMSKHVGNVIDPFEMVDRVGADAVRWYMITSSHPWVALKFDPEGVAVTQRKFFDTFLLILGILVAITIGLMLLAGMIFLGTGSAILALAVGGDRPRCTTLEGFLTFGAGLGAGLGLGLGLIRGRLSAVVGGLLAGQAAGLLGFAVSFLFLKSPLTRAHPAEMPFTYIVDFVRYYRFNVCAVGFGLTTLLTLLGLGLVEFVAERLGSREAPPPGEKTEPAP
jgi:hypothetical protein